MALRDEVRIYQKYRQLVKLMGTPVEVSLGEDGLNQALNGTCETWDDLFQLNVVGLHPVFLLAEHFSSNDGYSEESGSFLKLHARGDVMLIPAYEEFGEVIFLCTAFHKGNTRFSIVHFPEAPAEHKAALWELLGAYETR
jgi:hypothetical protein